MYSSIFNYEIKYWLRRPTIYFYFFTFFSIALLLFIGTAGFFDEPEKIVSKNVRIINSPFEINFIFKFFNKLFLFLLPTVIGTAIYKDFKSNSHSIIYSFPIQKRAYLFAKFFSSFFIVLSITLSVGVAIFIGENFPYLHASKIGDFQILGYLQNYLVFTIPNMFFFGLFVFSLIAHFRNIYIGYVTLILLFFIQSITQNVFGNSPFLIALLDPFGENAVLYETYLWSLKDKNTSLIPVFGVVLYNRLVWLVFSLSVFYLMYKKFQFHENATHFLVKKKKTKALKKQNFNTVLRISIPKVTYNFSLQQQLKHCWYLSNTYLLTIVKNWMFYCILVLGVFSMLFAIGRITNDTDLAVLPSTNIVLSIPSFFFITVIMLLTFIYSGMLIHKDRIAKMNQLVDVTATNNWTFLLSRVIAVLKMQMILLFTMMISGIIIQTLNSYYNYELQLYLFHLFVLQFYGLIIWAFTSFFIHNVLKNNYLSIFVLLLIWLGVAGVKQFGIHTNLLLFNFDEPFKYSDLNDYGIFLNQFFIVKSYWFSIAVLLLIATYLLWYRGFTESFKERIQNIATYNNKKIKVLSVLFLIITISLGFVIYNEEGKLYRNNSIKPTTALSNFKNNFKAYSKISNQPKIISVDINLDIYPEQRNFKAKGLYILKNKSNKKIDTVLIKTGFDENTEFSFNKNFKVIKEDSYFKFKAIKLEKPLQPKDSLELNFTIKNIPDMLFERNSNVLQNGTFLKQDILPRIGYFLDQELKHPANSLASKNQLGTLDADFIDFSTTISTSKKQIAISNGSLVKKWTANNRNYYQYKTDRKIKFSLAFISGNYEVKRELYNGVNFEIYHHKYHTHNIDKMLDGLKASLDYNTKYFDNSLYKEIRVIEFPMTEGVYATIKGNLIPTSERRFMANPEAKNQLDVSFKVQAHELTHHWWGNQLVHANVLGVGLLSESITDYITLQIFKSQFGEKKALQFLKHQHKRYIRGSVRNTNEPTLTLAKPEDIFVSYGKGSIAFNTLSNYLGEEKLNTILSSFYKHYKNRIDKYPTSLDLATKLKSAIPDSLQYIINDYFETITFYKTKINSVEYINNLVTVDFSYSKIRNKSQVQNFNDFIEIGFYDKNDKLLKIETIKVNSSENKIQFKSEKKPSKIIIDPNYLLIEKNRDDNSTLVN